MTNTELMSKQQLIERIEDVLQSVYIENAQNLKGGDISPLDENILIRAIEDIADVLIRVQENNL